MLKTIGGWRWFVSFEEAETRRQSRRKSQQKENRRRQSFFEMQRHMKEKEGKNSLKEKKVAGWSIEVSVNIQVEE